MKFFIVSYHGDSRGHRFASQLSNQLSEYINVKHPRSKSQRFTWGESALLNGYSIYHHLGGHTFFNKDLHGPVVSMDFDPIKHNDSQRLHPYKYNLVITHAYTKDQLQTIKSLFSGHNIII